MSGSGSNSTVDTVINDVVAPIRTLTFSWMGYVAETMSKDAPAYGAYGGVIKLGEFGFSLLNSASDTTAENVIPTLGITCGGFLLSGAITTALGVSAPFWVVGGLGLALGYVGEELTKDVYSKLYTYAPTIYKEINNEASDVASAMNKFVKKVSDNIATLAVSAYEKISAKSSSSPGYAKDFSHVLAAAISTATADLASDGTAFLKSLGVSDNGLASDMSKESSSVNKWLSAASSSLLANPTLSFSQQELRFSNYVSANSTTAPVDFISVAQASADSDERGSSLLSDGTTYTSSPSSNEFSLSDTRSGETVLNGYTKSFVPVSQVVDTQTDQSIITTVEPDGVSTFIGYSGLNGTGAVTEIDQENPNGTSQITDYDSLRSSYEISYDGPNGTGNPTSSTVSISYGDFETGTLNTPNEFVTLSGAGTFVIDSPESFIGTISNFQPGDTIDLAGVSVLSASLLDSSTILVHETYGRTQYINVTSISSNQSFLVDPDGNGGSDIVSPTYGNYGFSGINVPSSFNRYPYGAGGDGNLYVTGINNNGEIIGYFEGGTFGGPFGVWTGFSELDGNYTALLATVSSLPFSPGLIGEYVHAVNDGGTIVGQIEDYQEGIGGLEDDRGVVFANGSSSIITEPNDVPSLYNLEGTTIDLYHTSLTGINDEGDIVGTYITSSGTEGFIESKGTFTSLGDLIPTGISNSGTIFGGSFTDYNGTITSLDGYDPTAISDNGIIVGNYTDSNGIVQGFVDNNGTFVTVYNPNENVTLTSPFPRGTFLEGVNDSGEVVGYYYDSNGIAQGFVAFPTASSSASSALVAEIRPSNSKTLNKMTIITPSQGQRDVGGWNRDLTSSPDLWAALPQIKVQAVNSLATSAHIGWIVDSLLKASMQTSIPLNTLSS